MSREWKPGDVAHRTNGFGQHYRGFLTESCGAQFHDAGPHWHYDDGGWDPIDTKVRPLVVLDPENADDVKRLYALLPGYVTTESLASALRELVTTPPKPAEPTGLGAVVEDKAGCMWIRSDSSHADPNWRRCGEDDWHDYSQIAAVRVLGEGVQA